MPRKNARKPCSIKACTNLARARGYCSSHLNRFYRYGDPLVAKGTGVKRRNGEPYINNDGYMVQTVKGTTRGVHRIVMEQHLGRALRPGENVHHKNGVRSDNRLSNLEVWTKPQPQGVRLDDLYEWADELIEQQLSEMHVDVYEDGSVVVFGV